LAGGILDLAHLTTSRENVSQCDGHWVRLYILMDGYTCVSIYQISPLFLY